MIAKEAAIQLVRVYALRGDDVDHFKKGYLGSRCDEYSASVGGYMWGKNDERLGKVPNTKILVTEVNGKLVNEVFSLYKIWEEILAGKIQKTLL